MSRLPVAARIVRDREIVRLRNAGLSVDTIAEKLRVNHRTVFRVVKRGGPSEAALRGPERLMVKRDAEIVQFAQSADDYGNYPTLQEIGDWYGITREWVRQILKRAGVKKPSSLRVIRPKPPCAFNGCSELATRVNGKWCAKHKNQHAPRVTLTCASPRCGNPIERRRSSYRPTTGQGLAFCNNVCQGVWLAANHGFGARRAG